MELKYGKAFRDYFVAKTLFFDKEKKKEPWAWIGVFFHFLVSVVGLVLLPISLLEYWIVAVSVSGAILIWGIFKIWWRQRRYTSFNRWLKHERRTSYREP